MHDRPFAVVDDRQPDWYPAALEQAGFTVRVRRLDEGDVLWDSPYGRVGVEDKSLKDLIASRQNGRLDDELRRLSAAVSVPILLLRCHYAPATVLSHGWAFEGIDNLLLGRQLHGIYTVHCIDDPESVGQRLKALHDYLLRAKPKEGKRREFSWLDPLDDRAELFYVLLGLVRGVKNRREVAEALSARHSLAEVLGWGESDFRRFGFTPVMSKRLAALVGRL